MFYSLFIRDMCEIFFYSSCIFIFCKWLNQDKSKNLVGYFLIYSFFCISIWIAQLPTLFFFLSHYTPVILLFFIIVHQKTLQRNFIKIYESAKSEITSSHWIEQLMQSCLTTINNNKSVTIIIENNDPLHTLLLPTVSINAELNKPLLDILIATPYYNTEEMIWVTAQGKIKAINTCWLENKENSYQTSLFHTTYLDTIIMITHIKTRSFTILHKGKEINLLSAHQAQVFIKKHSILFNHKGIYRENKNEQSTIV